MTPVRWSLAAEADLFEIWRKISYADPSAANRVYDTVRAKDAALAHMPMIGTPISKGRRKLSIDHYPYVILYRVGAQGVLILAVRHMARNWRAS